MQSRKTKLNQTHDRVKRATGLFYTIGNPFEHAAFYQWAIHANIRGSNVLEPFAGSNSLIGHLERTGFCNRFASYDIRPTCPKVQPRDTLANFPKGYRVCVTNPPWLAKNSATFRKLPYPNTKHDNLYKYCLEKCLDNCEWVAVIIPESFICANLFHERLIDCISLRSSLFRDTGHPVCLALFGPDRTTKSAIWADNERIGTLEELNTLRPQPMNEGCRIAFNVPNGNVGLIALDNTIGPSIRFCDVGELADYTVKKSGRHITKVMVEGEIDIEAWNSYLKEFRERTKDVLLTCYKGIRRDGMYRRRLDWKIARGIVHHAT